MCHTVAVQHDFITQYESLSFLCFFVLATGIARPMLKTKVLEKYTDKIQELFGKYDNVATEDVDDVKALCEDVKRVGMLLTRRETKASVKIPKAIQEVISKKISNVQPTQTPRRGEHQPQDDEGVLI